MKRIASIRSLLLIALTMTLIAVSPGVAAANLFIEEPVEEVPSGMSVFAADEYPTEVTGERLTLGGKQGKLEILDTGSAEFLCDSVDISGGTLSGAASELELEAEFPGKWENCTLETLEHGWFQVYEVAMNSCRYALSDLGPMTSGYPKSAGEIVCDEGDKIEIRVLEGAGCIVSIPPQPLDAESELGNFSSEGEKVVGASILGSGITYSVSNTFLCNKTFHLPPKGTYENGSVEVNVLLRGD